MYGKKKNVSDLLLNRGEFGGPESSTRNMDMDTPGATDRRASTCAKQMVRLWGAVSNNDAEIVEDAQVEPDLTRSLVASTLHYAEETYPDWADTFRRVLVGVMLTVQTRDVNIQGQIRSPPPRARR